MSNEKKPAKPDLLWNLVFNVGIPFLLLTKLSKETPWEPLGLVTIPGLGPIWGLVVALAFPFGYGLYDFIRRRTWNVISIIGLLSVALSGGLSLLKLDPFWFAVKEAAVPLVIGTIVVGSQWTRRPLVRAFLLNPDIIDAPRLDAALADPAARSRFDALLRQASYRLGAVFVVSAVLNFVLARVLVKSEPGTEAFAEELGRMTVWSLVVITVPMMVGLMYALYHLFKGLHGATGLKPEELMRS